MHLKFGENQDFLIRELGDWLDLTGLRTERWK
jgi:hypothetical protein